MTQNKISSGTETIKRGGERLQVPQSFQGVTLECLAATFPIFFNNQTFELC